MPLDRGSVVQRVTLRRLSLSVAKGNALLDRLNGRDSVEPRCLTYAAHEDIRPPSSYRDLKLRNLWDNNNEGDVSARWSSLYFYFGDIRAVGENHCKAVHAEGAAGTFRHS